MTKEEDRQIIVDSLNELLDDMNTNAKCEYVDEMFFIRVKDRTPSFVEELNHYLMVRFNDKIRFSVACTYSQEYIDRCNELFEEIYPGLGLTFHQLTENTFAHSHWRKVGEAMGEDITLGH